MFSSCFNFSAVHASDSTCIKMAKANYYKSEVEQNVGNPKEIWRTINELTYHKCTSNSSISELKSGDNSFTKPAEMCEILNDHFTSVGPNLASTLPSGNTLKRSICS